MSAPPPPPSYNESMQGQGYQPHYGATNAPQGLYGPQPGMPYQQQPQGHPYQAPHGGAYNPQYPPMGPVDPSKGYTVPPSYQSTTSTNTNIVIGSQQPVVVVGGCPSCRVGVLEDDFTCLGVLCAIIFFPLGVLCCLAMRQRRCANCGSVFG